MHILARLPKKYHSNPDSIQLPCLVGKLEEKFAESLTHKFQERTDPAMFACSSNVALKVVDQATMSCSLVWPSIVVWGSVLFHK